MPTPIVQGIAQVDLSPVLQALREIKVLLAGQQNSALVTATFGLVGVVAGTVATWLGQWILAWANGKREREKLKLELTADIVSRQRQQWMDSIRDAASVALAELDMVRHMLITHEQRPAEPLQARLDELFMSAQTKTILIMLKLNPEKPMQRAVIEALKRVQDLVSLQALAPEADRDAEYSGAKAALMLTLQGLFQETWHRIKGLES
jgi:hypothetical protein